MSLLVKKTGMSGLVSASVPVRYNAGLAGGGGGSKCFGSLLTAGLCRLLVQCFQDRAARIIETFGVQYSQIHGTDSCYCVDSLVTLCSKENVAARCTNCPRQ